MLLSFDVSCQNLTENDSLKIIGKWGIYVTRTSRVDKNNDGKLLAMESKCNVCPELTFSGDRFAKINFPNGEKEEYLWTLKNEKIKFLKVGGNQDNKKLDDEYNIKIIEKNGYLEMELEFSKDESYIYILRK